MKPFFLFCFYEALAGMTYFYLAIQRAITKNKSPLSFGGTVCFWITNIITMPICFSLIFLSLSLFLQLYDNVTTYEAVGYSGAIQRRYPCIGILAGYSKHKINDYDLFWPNNITQVMGSNFLMWFVPFWQPEMQGWGLYYPKLPALT